MVGGQRDELCQLLRQVNKLMTKVLIAFNVVSWLVTLIRAFFMEWIRNSNLVETTGAKV